MIRSLLVVVLVIISVLLIAVILIQPDRSRTMAKTQNILDQEKEGIEKFTEYVAFLFMFLAIIYNVIR